MSSSGSLQAVSRRSAELRSETAVALVVLTSSIVKVPANLILVKNVSLVGLHWGAYYVKEPSAPAGVWKALLKEFARGSLKPIVFDGQYESVF